MRIMVPGAAGFIGFHLCERLLDDGHEVVGVDNYVTGQPQNIADLGRRPRFTFLMHDITNPIPASAGPVELVFNLACPASPVDFGPRRLAIMAVCSAGVWNLLSFCESCGARLTQASTSEVYGDPQEHPQRESYHGNVNPIGPRSCYDEGKRFAEALIACYQRDGKVEARIARIFNTYGPRMRADDGRVLPNFVSQAMTGRALTVHGDGRQTRSFCYVSDLVDGLWRLSQSDVTAPVNLGNPHEVTILEFAQQVIRLTGSSSTIQHVPRLADDPALRRPDITRARECLDWRPAVELEAGLQRTIAALQAEQVAGKAT